jgi:hypothetical protein
MSRATEGVRHMIWEYTSVLHDLTGGRLDRLWEKGNDESRPCVWDMIEVYGQKGWELVSTTPMGDHGNTDYLLFMFKRPRTA